MGLIHLKKELKQLSKEQLIELIAEVYKKEKTVKEFFDFYVKPDEVALFDKYRQKIWTAFYPKRGRYCKLKDGKQAIRDFKKFSPSTELIADLMLSYVETGIQYVNDSGYANDAFYNSMETTLLEALKLIKEEKQLNKFKGRIHKMLADTKSIGWAFHRIIHSAWTEYYANETV